MSSNGRAVERAGGFFATLQRAIAAKDPAALAGVVGDPFIYTVEPAGTSLSGHHQGPRGISNLAQRLARVADFSIDSIRVQPGVSAHTAVAYLGLSGGGANWRDTVRVTLDRDDRLNQATHMLGDIELATRLYPLV